MPRPISGLNNADKLAKLNELSAPNAKTTLENLKAQLHPPNGQIKSGVLKLMHTTSDSKAMTFERKGWWQFWARRQSKMETTAKALGDLLKKAGADEQTNRDYQDYINGTFRPLHKSGAQQTHFKIDTKDAVYFIKRALGEHVGEARQPAEAEPGKVAEETSAYELHGIVLGDDLNAQQRKDILKESKQLYGGTGNQEGANPFTGASKATLISQVKRDDWSDLGKLLLRAGVDPKATVAQQHIRELTEQDRKVTQHFDAQLNNAADHLEMFRKGGFQYLPEIEVYANRIDQLNQVSRRWFQEFEQGKSPFSQGKSKLSIEVEGIGRSANNPAKGASDRLATAIKEQKQIETPDVPFLRERKALRLGRLKIDHEVYKPNEGICAGITAAWTLSMLQTSEATDPEKFADLFRDSLQHTGAHWQQQGIGDANAEKEAGLFDKALKAYEMDKSTQRTTIELNALGDIRSNKAVIDKFVDRGGDKDWSGSLGFVRHAIGIGKKDDKWHIMDPNVGLMVYDDKATWEQDLYAYMDLRRQEPAPGPVNPFSERSPHDVSGVVLVADN